MGEIVWISGREIGADLAGTTEVSICEALGQSGANCHLISPGSITSADFKHSPVKKLNFPGLNTISGANGVRRLMSREGTLNFEAMLVDWRYVYSLRRELMQLKGPWFIIDRGPPAYSGILSRLQKIYWKRAWKVAEDFANGGLVVSDEHERFVTERLNIDMEIRKVPAGCHSNQHLREKEDPEKKLLLAYTGRLDRKRGTEKIINLADLLNEMEIPNRIYIAGEGNMHREMKKHSARRENIEYLGKLSSEETQSLLARCHIGIMPMPDMPIWRIASPLKLSEYLAAGLAIIGPSHQGNRLRGDEVWDLLSKEMDWPLQSIDKITKEYFGRTQQIIDSSIESSEKVSWKNIGIKLIKDLNDLI